MSSSTLQAIWPGEKHENIVEYRNAWGTAPLIWSFFCEWHLHLGKTWWMLNADRTPNPLWGAWKKKGIPKAHRAVLLFTLDHLYVQKSDYGRFARDLRQFIADARLPESNSNHWPKIAEWFEADHDYPAVALWCTSVTSDPFDGPMLDEETGERSPFDWSRACDLYSELDEADADPEEE